MQSVHAGSLNASRMMFLSGRRRKRGGICKSVALNRHTVFPLLRQIRRAVRRRKGSMTYTVSGTIGEGRRLQKINTMPTRGRAYLPCIDGGWVSIKILDAVRERKIASGILA